MASTSIPLSRIARDPLVKTAFERAERDDGDTFAVPDAPPPLLPSGYVGLGVYRLRNGRTARIEPIPEPEAREYLRGWLCMTEEAYVVWMPRRHVEPMIASRIAVEVA